MPILYKIMNDDYDTIRVTDLTHIFCEQVFKKDGKIVKTELVSIKLDEEGVVVSCSCSDTDIIVIPPKIGKLRVAGIKDGAFDNVKCDAVILTTTGVVRVGKKAVPKSISLIIHGDIFESYKQSNWICGGKIINA